MPRVPRGQMWGGGVTSSSSDDEDRYEYDESSDDGSSMNDDESEFTPDTEDEAEPEPSKKGLDSYEYKLREHVWVKPRGCLEWFRGTVVKVRDSTTKDAQRRGRLYLVVFRRHFTNMRDCFSSVEGNIKPDTPSVRALVSNSR